jgi:hypothetical protein
VSRASDGTNLGFTRDWHFKMRKSGKPDLRAGAKTRDPGEIRRAKRVTILRFAILALGPGSRSARFASYARPGHEREIQADRASAPSIMSTVFLSP